MRESTRKKGSKAEHIARRFLEDKGYIFLQSNFYTSGGEIDLIMKQKQEIVFVEVKSLQRDSEYSIYETITKTKFNRIKFAVNTCLLEQNKLAEEWRIDFVGVIMHNKEVCRVEHQEFLNMD